MTARLLRRAARVCQYAADVLTLTAYLTSGEACDA